MRRPVSGLCQIDADDRGGAFVGAVRAIVERAIVGCPLKVAFVKRFSIS
jgi:hypothetical protein